MPKISIIIPNYNYGWTLPMTIQSVLDQTFTDWELIIVDDLSDDNSIEIINGFIKKYLGKIILYTKKIEEKGLANSYKIGVNLSKGKYIAFLEADDLLMPKSLEIRNRILDTNKDTVLIFNNSKLFGDDRKFFKLRKKEIYSYLKKVGKMKNGLCNLKDKLKENNPILTLSTVMTRKDALGDINFNNRYNAYFDWWFYAQLSLKGLFYKEKKKLTKWRLHQNSFGFLHNFDPKIKQEAEYTTRKEISNLLN